MSVEFTNESGRVLAAWQIRAGMTIVSTTYSHGDRSLACVLRDQLDAQGTRETETK